MAARGTKDVVGATPVERYSLKRWCGNCPDRRQAREQTAGESCNRLRDRSKPSFGNGDKIQVKLKLEEQAILAIKTQRIDKVQGVVADVRVQIHVARCKAQGIL